MKARYFIETWDVEKQAYTPQKGVRRGPWSKWGLRRAIRKLREMGYACDYSSKTGVGDAYVQIWREER